MNKNLADYIYTQISPLTSKYIEDLNISSETFAEALKVGKLFLNNLKLTKEILLDLNSFLMPTLKLNSIIIGELILTIPQMANLMKNSVEIEIKNVKIIAEIPFINSESEFDLRFSLKNYMEQIFLKKKLDLIELLKKDIPSNIEKKNSKSFFSIDYTALIMSIVENFIIKISDVEIEILGFFKIKLWLAEYFTTDNKYQYIFAKYNKENYLGHKNLKINNFQILVTVGKHLLPSGEMLTIPQSVVRMKIQSGNSKANLKNKNFEFDLDISKIGMNFSLENLNTVEQIQDHFKNIKNYLKIDEIVNQNLIYRPDNFGKYFGSFTQLSQGDVYPNNNLLPNIDKNILKWRYAIKCVIDINKSRKVDEKTKSNLINTLKIQDINEKNSKLRNEFLKFFPLIKSSNNLYYNTSEEFENFKFLVKFFDQDKICELIQPLIEEIVLESKSKTENKGFLNLFSGLGNQKGDSTTNKTNIPTLSKEEREDITKQSRDIVNPFTQKIPGEAILKIKAGINEFEFNLLNEDNSKLGLNLSALHFSLINSSSHLNDKDNFTNSLFAECKMKSIIATLLKNYSSYNELERIDIIKEFKMPNDQNNDTSCILLDFSYKDKLDKADQKNLYFNANIERFDIELNLEIIKFFIPFCNFESFKKKEENKHVNSPNKISPYLSELNNNYLKRSEFTFELNVNMKSRHIIIPFLISEDSSVSNGTSIQKINYLSVFTNDSSIQLKKNNENSLDFLIKAGINQIKSLTSLKCFDKIQSQMDVDDNRNDDYIINKYDENFSDNVILILENLNIGISFSLHPKNKFFQIKFSQGLPLNTKSSSSEFDSFTFYITADLFRLINNLTKFLQNSFSHLDKKSNQLIEKIQDNSMLTESIDTKSLMIDKVSVQEKFLKHEFELELCFEINDVNLVINLSKNSSANFKASGFYMNFILSNSLNSYPRLGIHLELNKIKAIFRERFPDSQFEINRNSNDNNVKINNFNVLDDFVFLTTDCESKNFFMCNVEIIKDKSTSIEANIEDINLNYDNSKVRPIVIKLYEIFSDQFNSKNQNENQGIEINSSNSTDTKYLNQLNLISNEKILETFSKNFYLQFTFRKFILNLSDADELTQYELVNEEFLIKAKKLENDYTLNFEISKMILSDMTDFPFNINSPNNLSKNIIFALDKKLKMNWGCSYLDNKLNINLNVHLNNPYLNFIRQPIERLIKFIQKDVRIWQDDLKKFSDKPQNSANFKLNENLEFPKNNAIVNYLDMAVYKNSSKWCNLNFLFEIHLENILVEIKANQSFEDSFKLDFGKIKIFNQIENEIENENDSIKNPNQIKISSRLFKINFCCENFYIVSVSKSTEKFFILQPSNLYFTISILNNEIPPLSFNQKESEIFNGINCEMKMDRFELNFRQRDLNYLMKCIEMNFDNQEVMKKETRSKSKIISVTQTKLLTKENNLPKSKKFDLSLNTKEIKINLIEKDKLKPLSSLILYNLRLNIQSTSKVNFNSTDENIFNADITTSITFKIQMIEIYFFSNLKENLTNNFDLIMSYNFEESSLSDRTIENFENFKDQVDLSITISSKDAISTNVKLELNHLKFNPRLDFLILIKIFIEKSISNFDKTYPRKISNVNLNFIQSDLEIILKNTLFTLSIDDESSLNNLNKATIGLQVKLIKIVNLNKDTNIIRNTLEQIKSLANDSVDINNLTLKENFADIFVELMNIDIFTYLGDDSDNSKNLNLSKRYILNQNTNESILVIKSSLYLHFNEKFEIKESLHLVTELHRLQIKLSYKDILSFVKVANMIYSDINSDEFKQRMEGLKSWNFNQDVYSQKNQTDVISLDIQNSGKNNFMTIANFNNNCNNFNQSDDFPALPFENMHIMLNGFKISLILIDDQADVYYPFLTLNIDNLNNSLLIRNGEKKMKSLTLTEIEVLSHNYIAGEWEPVVENLRAEISYSREEIDESQTNNIVPDKNNDNKMIELSNLNLNPNKEITIKSNLIFNFPANLSSPVNINLSDMNISFIYSNMSSWIKKLLNEFEIYNRNSNSNKTSDLPNPESIKNQKLALIISNHKMKNLTGRNLFITQGDNMKILLKIDACLDLEYIPTIDKNKKNTVAFSIDKESPESHVIYIDQLGAQFHTINFNLPFNNLKQSNNSYFISEVTSLNRKKLITIYSPIVFYNKTDTSLLLNLINYDPLTKENVEYILILGQREKQAVPYEFLTANYEIHKASTFSKSQSYKLRDILDSQEYFYNEVSVGSSIYNLSRNVKKSLKNVREIKISASYSIVNCLPFDLKITLPHKKERHILKKSERKYIDTLSIKNSLNVILEVGGFHTLRGAGVILYDNFNVSEENKGEKIKFIKLERIIGNQGGINLNQNSNNINKEPIVNINVPMTNQLLNNSLVISYCVLKNKFLQNREIVIYSTNVIINETRLPDLKLFYDPKREIAKYKSDTINIENEIIIYNNNPNEDTKFFLQIDSAQSSYVDIGNVKENTNVAVQCYNKSMYYEFIIQASMSSLPSLKYDTELYSNIFTIKSSVIIHNNIENYKICIGLHSDLVIYDIIENMQFAPFYFFGHPSGKTSPICIKPVVFDDNMNEIGGLEWSQPFLISNTRGLFTIPIKFLNEKNKFQSGDESFVKKMYLNCEIKEEDLITHLEISLANYQNSQFIIENNLKSNLNDKSYVIKVSQENYEKVNTDFVLVGKYITFSLYDYFNNNSTKNINKINFEIFEVDKNIANEQDVIILNEILFPNKPHSIAPKSKFKFEIFEDGIKKEFITDSGQNLRNHLFPYPHHHDDFIYPDTKIKILFLSNGIKKTIKFINKYSESPNHDFRSITSKLPNKNIFNFEIFVEKLSISIIFDNLSRDKKLRNYTRNEIIHIFINSISSTYKKETFYSDENNDNSELNFSLYDIQMDNQISRYAKYPNVLRIQKDDVIVPHTNKITSVPFFNLTIFSQINKNDRMSTIKFLTYNIQPIKIGIDVEFIEAILIFLNNLFYQLNTSYLEINEIFKPSSDDRIKTFNNRYGIYSSSHQKSNYKYYANLFETSNVTILISICEKGFKEFLYRHLNIGSLLASVINNLTVVEETKIQLNGEVINYFMGSIWDIFTKIFIGYRQKFISRLFSIGAKGLFLGIIKIFSKEQTVPEIEPFMTIKMPRAFYGKFRHIKKYEPLHAYICDLVRREKIQIFKNFELNFYNAEIFKLSNQTKDEVCLIFTTTNFILINMFNLMPFYIVDYYAISDVRSEPRRTQKEFQVVVEFNQKIDGIEKYVIPSASEDVAKKIALLIKEAKEVNLDEYYRL